MHLKVVIQIKFHLNHELNHFIWIKIYEQITFLKLLLMMVFCVLNFVKRNSFLKWQRLSGILKEENF